jgi:hypothetical protein
MYPAANAPSPRENGVGEDGGRVHPERDARHHNGIDVAGDEAVQQPEREAQPGPGYPA